MKEARQRLSALTQQVATAARRLTYNTHATTPEVRRQSAHARVEAMKQQHEPTRRMPASYHEANERDIFGEEMALAKTTASVALYYAQPVLRELSEQYRAFTQRCRRDTSLSMPDAFDHVNANGMLTAALLTETLRPIIAAAGAADLLHRYTRAMETKDARGRIEAELIEQRIETGGLAARPEDLPVVKRLQEYADAVADLRVPFSPDEQHEIEETIAFGRKAVGMADLAGVHPVAADHPAYATAKAAFEAESPIFQAAVRAQVEAAAAAAEAE